MAAADPTGWVVAALRDAGCVWAVDEARLLKDHAADDAELAGLVARRAAGEPLEYLLGWAEFCGLKVVVEPGVFVPRRRSEQLVRLAAEGAPPNPRVLDLCCGSGALGAALVGLLSPKPVELHAVDVDAAAVRCARRNLPGSAQVYHGDLYEPLPDELRGGFDVILANAPYVPTDAIHLLPAEARLHEPRTALDGGADGLDIHRRIAEQAAGWLTPDGRLLIEVSDLQLPAMRNILRHNGLGHRVVPAGETAVVIARQIRT